MNENGPNFAKHPVGYHEARASLGTHTSVLMDEVLEGLEISSGDVVLDATVGGAGHFSSMLSKLGPDGILIGIDEDSGAIARAREVLAADRRAERPTVHLVEDNFRNLARVLERLDIVRIDAALFDLGWSGFQLHEGKGFSFQGEEPLLMTYGNPEARTTAAELVNTLSDKELGDLIHNLGEERFARAIARTIVHERSLRRIISTSDLVAVIGKAVPAWYRNRRTHFATKTFQALRIAVNDELGAASEGISAAIDHLAEGGRLAVITFHSIEDRAVKGLLRAAVSEGKGSLVTKKVIIPSKNELTQNPRSRSAKLRIFEACGEKTMNSLDTAYDLTYA